MDLGRVWTWPVRQRTWGEVKEKSALDIREGI